MAIEPVTRREMFMAKAGGQDVTTPTPITREEMFLSQIGDSGGGGSEPDMVITISHSLNTLISTSDVSITSGSVEGVVEKLWNGELVDIRVRGFEVNGSFAADAAEVSAFGNYYDGSLFVRWSYPTAYYILFRVIEFDIDGGVISTKGKTVTMN